MKTNIFDPNWWAELLISFLSVVNSGDWLILVITLAVSFSATYILKIIYFSFVNDNPFGAYHIRLIAIISGFIAAYLIWKGTNTLSMKWYTAGIMIGPLSIMLHHIIEGFSKTEFAKKRLPWLYPLVKGQQDKRKTRRLK